MKWKTKANGVYVAIEDEVVNRRVGRLLTLCQTDR